MVAADFDVYWRTAYPDAPPLGHLLRTAYPRRWLRVHSLPGAQRYPSTPADWRELLGRQCTVFADLVGDPADGVLVTGEYVFGAEPAGPVRAEGALRGLAWSALPPVALPADPQAPDEHGPNDWFRPACAPFRWTAAAGDVVLRDLALGRARAFFVSEARGCVLAPYDGGMDLILPDEAARDRCRDRYAAWLSTRTDGL
ncbi:DUF3885 domain-containing protein [Hymenobacter terricola]|uniref:DUF3885 domain-containing protein n=1 Tax=Hymenobacter terricola TaxID=2819236 RepID=UPI001B3131E3|nr:hypothetical protein [Hymenobacter terricola]